MRELVFGKGDAGLLGTFGTEQQEQQRQQGLFFVGREAPLMGSSALVSQGDEVPKGQPLWVEDVTGDISILDGTAGDDGREEGEGRASKGPAWVDEDDAGLKVRR